jgi:signal transduction histidine kinase
MNPYIPLILLSVISAIYLLIAGLAAARRGFREHIIRLLLLFLVVSAGAELLHAWQLAKLSVPLEGFLSLLPIQVVLLLAFLYFHLSRTFLHLQTTDQDWWRPGVAVMAVELLLQVALFLVLPPVLNFGKWGIQHQQLGLSLLIIGWMIFTGGVATMTLRSYRQAQTPWHRNRIKYWFLGLCFVVGGNALLFAGHGVLGSSLYLAATLIISYAVLTYQPFDVNQVVRYILSYLITTLLIILLYLIGFVAMQYVFQMVLGYDSLVPMIITALMLVFLSNPILRSVQRLVNHLIVGRDYDPTLLVRQYSANISNILSLKHLAVAVLQMIQRTMNIEHGALFLVRHLKDEQGQDYFRLQVIKQHGATTKEFTPGNLQSNGLVATHLAQERRPLTQYDLDMLPHFEQVSPEERTWLTDLGMEVYVPIHAKNEWIGLLAFGPKTSHQPYFDNDLTLLSTLADQTAVALQNARLVEDLVKLNQNLKQTYQKLDRANRQLKELDDLKTSFIGVITHELCSPFMNIDLSLQLLERYGIDQLKPNQREQLEQLKSSVKTVKQMIDNLVNFATFLSKRGEMRIVEVDVFTIIAMAVSLNESIATKKQIKCHTQIPTDLPPVFGDPQRLTDALHHLIQNAVKFTEPGGQVWVRCQSTAEALRFEVQDTGMGVPTDKLSTLWDGFAQMSDPLRRGMEGLGLGLTLVQYVAHAHNGKAFAKSKEGVGSLFGFQIPLNGQR